MHLPRRTEQVVFVEADSWTSETGTLEMFSKSAHGWVRVGSPIAVSLGRDGLGWGNGLQAEVESGPQKAERDGKAPAGIFRYGTAFGYGEAPPVGLKLPYRQATERDFYIDDPESPQYNQWVTLPTTADPHREWKSFERMRRNDGLYELGIVVEQNTDPAIPGRGSAIFFHIWRAPGSPTVGCTAMAKENLLALMTWLDPAKHPLLIQATCSGIKRIRFAARTSR